MENNGEGILKHIENTCGIVQTYKPLTKDEWGKFLDELKNGYNRPIKRQDYFSGKLAKVVFGDSCKHLDDDKVYLIEY